MFVIDAQGVIGSRIDSIPRHPRDELDELSAGLADAGGQSDTSEPGELGAEEILEHLPPGSMRVCVEIIAVAAELAVAVGECRNALMVDEQRRHQSAEFVARRPVDRPVAGQMLRSREDLLGDQPRSWGCSTQAECEGGWIAEPVDVINAQTIHGAVRHTARARE